MKLAIFDLDNTLLAGDSDYSWGSFLADKGVVDGDEYRATNARYYAEYEAGTLDIHEFLAFSLAPLAEQTMETLGTWHREFMEQRIRPLILPAGQALVEQHRQAGHELMILTATNDFITGPIARELGVPNLIATQAEIQNGRYTGQVAGTPSFQHGKVERLDAWLSERGDSLEESWFYSDSINDLPLLEQVDHPYAVDPDEALRKAAQTRDWPILSLRDGHEATDGR